MRVLLRPNGMGIVQALMLAVLVGALGLVVMQMGQRLQQSSRQMTATSQAKLMHDLLVNVVTNDSVWSATQKTPFHGSLTLEACRRDPASDSACPPVPASERPTPEIITPAEVKPLVVKGADGVLYYDPNNPDSGFTLDAKPCMTFVKDPLSCPLRMEYSWGFACDPRQTACRNPIILYGDLKIADKYKDSMSAVNINEQRFRIRERIKVETDYLRSSCETMGAFYDETASGIGADTKCRCASPGGIVNANCKRVNEVSGCADGLEVRYNGTNFVCVVIPPDPPPPASSFSSGAPSSGGGGGGPPSAPPAAPPAAPPSAGPSAPPVVAGNPNPGPGPSSTPSTPPPADPTPTVSTPPPATPASASPKKWVCSMYSCGNHVGCWGCTLAQTTVVDTPPPMNGSCANGCEGFGGVCYVKMECTPQ